MRRPPIWPCVQWRCDVHYHLGLRYWHPSRAWFHTYDRDHR